MTIQFDPTGSVEGLSKNLAQVASNRDTHSLFILACDGNGFTPEAIDPLLTKLPIPVFGGIFPEIIYQNDHYPTGTLVIGTPIRPEVHLLKNISDPDIDFSEVIDEMIPETGLAQTMFVWVDGLSTRIADLISGLFDILGLELNVIGGGAGSLSFEQKSCIFSNEGLLKDCAQLILTDIKSGIGVSHGWKSISGPYQVTSSTGPKIETIDWRPAFEVYKEVVEKASGKSFAEEDFFSIAQGYPFGINKMGEERIVRDPIVLGEAGALVCIGEVQEGSFVDILEGNIASLVQAAQHAMEMGRQSFPFPAETSFHLFIDCISRVLFMQEEFHQELTAVQTPGLPLIGALTLGEIANSGKDYLEFYNKTAVLGVMGV